MYQRTRERMFKEPTGLALHNEVRVVAPPERKCSVWIGAQRRR